ncbi:hypothetical protein MMC29_005924 [Sticta canariensis]|nr:hypothetical protein [Sticta canariensis]
MSADLWREFASPNQKRAENPLSRVPNQNAEGQSGLEEDEFGDFKTPEPWDIEEHLDIFAVPNPLDQVHPPKDSSVQSLVYEQTSRSDHKLLMEERHSSSSPTTRVKPSKNDLQNLGSAKAPPIDHAAPHAGRGQASIQPSQPPENCDDVEWGDFTEESISIHEDSRSVNKETDRTDHVQALTLSNTLLSGPPNRARNVSPHLRTKAAQKEVAIVSHRGPPPSNVPPPSILLLVIIRIFQSMLVDLKNMTASADSSTGRDSWLDQQSINEMHKLFSMARAAARIIAGRKLRWRRDSRLSQNMKIGPANSGRSGGMKLTGLDRTENRREDGEVEEAIRTWKQQVGSLRAVVAIANSRQPGLQLLIPEISEKMPVQVGKASGGAMVAPTCCFLCGLKRGERIEKIDVQVEDSFGEWWTDHWGHVDCTIFWEEQKNSLNQR